MKSLKNFYEKCICRDVANISCKASEKWPLSRIFFREFCLLFWNKYLKEHFWMAGFVSRDLMQWCKTDEKWKAKESYWSQNYEGIERVSIGQKYQQTRNVFTSKKKLASNEKLSINLAVSKFQKRSFQTIFSKN